MKYLLALLLAVGAIGSFGLAQKDSFKTRSQNRWGEPIGEEFTVHITRLDRIGYVTLVVVLAMGALYIVARRKK
jgi:hypothetical protein